MLDLDFIRKNPEAVKKAISAKNERIKIDDVLALDKKRREVIVANENLRNKRNQTSEEIARLKNEKKDSAALISEMKSVGTEIKANDEKLASIEDELNKLLIWIPNIPAEDIPVGNEEANKEIRHWGKRKEFDFTALPHWETGKTLDILDLPTGTKITGSGFMLLKGMGAQLERALINFMIDLHTTRHGFKEIAPPYLASRPTMFATGQLPKLEGDMYHTSEDDLFLIPTAEVPLTNIFRDEILSYEQLPVYFVAGTACFRREAGSYGKDTRGINRVHQFNKVELLKFVHPDTSFDELEKLVTNAEAVLKTLELEYRVIKLSTGEMSFASAKTYDLEAWAPGINKYLEVSSCSNFTDFQARRGNIRFRDKDNKVKFVHTLNGSGIALPRTLIAIMENYQQKDGSVIIPDVLRPYMNGAKEIRLA
ncbi:MAG: serine--tRNA ligase [Planctomycetes bacterium]|nr:serine--tRNA ligase [Planctomycetota bacterium]